MTFTNSNPKNSCNFSRFHVPLEIKLSSLGNSPSTIAMNVGNLSKLLSNTQTSLRIFTEIPELIFHLIIILSAFSPLNNNFQVYEVFGLPSSLPNIPSILCQ
ncbi:hypothetical protein KFK09_003888 [Dendrobium nobile]|uniref:Uncharacterized protein n=1 Tax=Dendrobium nobile TaxID=94219 RepID=A0A8T3C3U0_DENNO|nr:hypothetical protein KFK09_003888 [Dendrobium nobile]